MVRVDSFLRTIQKIDSANCRADIPIESHRSSSNMALAHTDTHTHSHWQQMMTKAKKTIHLWWQSYDLSHDIAWNLDRRENEQVTRANLSREVQHNIMVLVVFHRLKSLGSDKRKKEKREKKEDLTRELTLLVPWVALMFVYFIISDISLCARSAYYSTESCVLVHTPFLFNFYFPTSRLFASTSSFVHWLYWRINSYPHKYAHTFTHTHRLCK